MGAATLLVVTVAGAPVLVQSPAPEPSPRTPTADAARAGRHADRVAELLVEHHCWSGPAPAGSPAPGHAVVTTPAGKVGLAPADVGFGIWLDGDEGVLHGFCP